MKKKILVTYSVKYIKEVELEVTEEINNGLNRGMVYNDNTKNYDIIVNQNEDILFDLPIPDLCIDEQSEELVEYIDGSFEIESFEI